jgi:hypothetical protein
VGSMFARSLVPSPAIAVGLFLVKKKPAQWRAESISEETWRRHTKYKPLTDFGKCVVAVSGATESEKCAR